MPELLRAMLDRNPNMFSGSASKFRCVVVIKINFSIKKQQLRRRCNIGIMRVSRLYKSRSHYHTTNHLIRVQPRRFKWDNSRIGLRWSLNKNQLLLLLIATAPTYLTMRFSTIKRRRLNPKKPELLSNSGSWENRPKVNIQLFFWAPVEINYFVLNLNLKKQHERHTNIFLNISWIK